MLICVDDVVLMMAEEAAAAEAGWSKKNKNPTLQCGEKTMQKLRITSDLCCRSIIQPVSMVFLEHS